MWGYIFPIREYRRAASALIVMSGAALCGAAIAYPIDWPERQGQIDFGWAALPKAFLDADIVHQVELDDSMIEVASAFDLGFAMNVVNFDLKPVRRGGARVPRLFVVNLPDDFDSQMAVEQRKEIFIRTVLPLILKANEEVRNERRQLIELQEYVSSGREISEAAQIWLDSLAEKYRASANDFTTLLRRVDTVSPTLALAQSIEESGWGRSRFARLGNALFGQRVWSQGAGFVPKERSEGEKFEVRAFDSLLDSVRSYVVNLNRHYAYEDYRAERAKTRAHETTLDARHLAATLIGYSERRGAYVEALVGLITSNRLDQFENVQLSSQPVPDETFLAAR